jgi:hypothetical protein
MHFYPERCPFEHRAGEIEHLRSKAMAPDALVMLDRIRPMKGRPVTSAPMITSSRKQTPSEGSALLECLWSEAPCR